MDVFYDFKIESYDDSSFGSQTPRFEKLHFSIHLKIPIANVEKI
jgi:hypothetical protein